MPDPRPPAPSRNQLAGGFPIAAGAIGGAVIGLIVQEPTLGFLAGLAAGVAVAALLWWRDGRRS